VSASIERFLRIFLTGLLAVAAPVGLTPKASGADPTLDPKKTLASIEQRSRKVIESVRSSVVALGAEGHGSGVIVTPEGLVLSQGHVSHAKPTEPFNAGWPLKPGTKIPVILHDGTRCEGELLGFDAPYDISLLKLTKPGPHPYVSLSEKSVVKLGDWVIKMGHPGGYRAGRGPVARLGRVLCVDADSFAADCMVQGGDSGGPYFDLEGRMVGIIRGMDLPRPVKESAGGFRERGGGLCLSVTPTPFILSRMEAMKRRELRLPKAGDSHHAWIDFAGPALTARDWTNGAATLAAYRGVTVQTANAIVKILDGNQSAALGTVVDSSGLVVSIASRLPQDPVCQLANGRTVAATPVGMVPAFDLVFLKLSDSNLQPTTWTDIHAVPAGTMLAAPGPDSVPLAAGIVSVPRRGGQGPVAKEVSPYCRIGRCPAALLPIIGSSVPERGYWVEFAEGEAAEAGILSGDLLLSVVGKSVRSHEDLASSVQGLFGGDRVTVQLLRGQKAISVSVMLRSNGFPRGIDGAPRPNYPVFLEHDLPLREDECGGPLLGLDGKSHGITISRAHAEGCIAIPADSVLELVKEFQAGKHLYLKTSAPALKAQGDSPVAVGLTLDELTAKLRERSSKFKSLQVEYEVTTEPRMDAKRLMSWNLLLTRGEKESHKVAFAGERRFAEVVRSGIVPYAVPPDSISPDPLAPRSIAAIVERRKKDALAQRGNGEFNYLFLRQGRAETAKYAYDGERCSVWNDAEKNWSMSLPSLLEMPSVYLAGLGLRPLDPAAAEDSQRAQSYDWFPANFASYRRCKLRPNKEIIEGRPCVVTEGEWASDGENQGKSCEDTIWFDPALGYAPRRREQRVNGLLVTSWSHTSFREFGAGCWLPRESVKTIYAPHWVAAGYRGRPAYDNRLVVKSVVASNVSNEVFMGRVID